MAGDFNPPSPCGEGPGLLKRPFPHMLFQSTLPMRGGTVASAQEAWAMVNFNPPSPCGEGQQMVTFFSDNHLQFLVQLTKNTLANIYANKKHTKISIASCTLLPILKNLSQCEPPFYFLSAICSHRYFIYIIINKYYRFSLILLEARLLHKFFYFQSVLSLSCTYFQGNRISNCPFPCS